MEIVQSQFEPKFDSREDVFLIGEPDEGIMCKREEDGTVVFTPYNCGLMQKGYSVRLNELIRGLAGGHNE